jgi:hypothetical protein
MWRWLLRRSDAWREERAPSPAREFFTPKKMADVVVARDVRQCLVASVAARDGFAALMRHQLARAPGQDATALGALAALAGAGACGPRWCGQ